MEGLGIGKGDEVITVANTFIGSVLPIIKAGAIARFVDCDPVTQQIDPQAVAAAITPKLLLLSRYIFTADWLPWMNCWPLLKRMG